MNSLCSDNVPAPPPPPVPNVETVGINNPAVQPGNSITEIGEPELEEDDPTIGMEEESRASTEIPSQQSQTPVCDL